MAGTVTVTLTKKDKPYDIAGFVEMKIEWVADAAAATVPNTALVSAGDYSAYLAGRSCGLAVTIPDGTTAPTANYDITIEDANGIDMMGGQLTNRSATAKEQVVPKIGDVYGARLCSGIWTFKLANNAVNSAAGTCYLYFI